MPDGQLIRLTRLWSKTSAKSGKSYLVGRLAGARLLVLEADDDPDGATHVVMLAPAAETPLAERHAAAAGCWVLANLRVRFGPCRVDSGARTVASWLTRRAVPLTGRPQVLVGGPE